MRAWRAAASVLCAVVLAACSIVSPPSTGARMARHLELSHASSEEAVRRELEEKFPVGTPRSEILRFLQSRRIDEDPLSRCHFSDDGVHLGIGCLFRFDKNHPTLVHQTWFVAFSFDTAQNLTSITVHLDLTGL